MCRLLGISCHAVQVPAEACVAQRKKNKTEDTEVYIGTFFFKKELAPTYRAALLRGLV
jgi:hypothetical protein